MTLFSFALGVWALLLTPGPTNSLMALAGAQRGWRRTVALLPWELAAYLLVVTPAALAGEAFMARWPQLSMAVKLAAAIWVLLLAIRLWRTPQGEGGAADVGARTIFTTTLLNPKGLIIGLVLLPPMGDPMFVPELMILAVSVPVIAMLWASLGSRASNRSAWLRRGAACWLGLLSGGLALGAMAH